MTIIETGKRLRVQGLQLIAGGVGNVIAVILLMWASGTAAAGLFGTWVPLLLQVGAIVVALLAVFLLIGGSVLLITSEKPPITRRKAA